MLRYLTKKLVSACLFIVFTLTHSLAQFPGCPSIDAGADQVLPCSQPCTNLTATPFHTGATTTYTVSSIPHAPPIPYNQAGGTAVSVNTDDVWSPIATLPFNFCYYGVNYNTVNIGSNGTIQFGPVSGGGFNPWSFTASCPSTALSPAGDVFGVYHDTDPSVGGSIKWYLLGTAPCRIFVVSYNNVPQFDCNNLISRSMIVLYETTNAIDVYVESKPTCTTWNNGNAIIGIQNPAGTQGLAAPGRNSGTNWSVTTPEGWRFTPNGAPNYTVAWFQGAAQIGTGSIINVCPGGPATYTAKVTYTRCDGTQVVEQDNVSVSFANLTPPTVTPTAESCNNYNNGSVVIDNPVGAGPYTVSITGPASAATVEPNTASGSATFSNLPDGNYSYTVTGNNGCTYSGTFSIAAGPLCCSVTASAIPVLCNGATTGSATANPVGLAPYTYSWTGGQTGQTASNLPAGSYTVTMTDNSGCTATASATVTSPTAITANTTLTQVTCNGLCNGAITVTASGGNPPYQYSLNGGAFQTGTSFTGLCAGTYAVTIRDANNCQITINRTITQPTIVSLALGTVVPATCGTNNGSLTVSASGGTGAYSYSIGGASQASPTFGSLAPGNYTITVTDANNCTATTTATITAVSTPIASILSQQNVSCFGGVNGSVLIGVSGGVAPITYSINGGPFQSSNSFGTLSIGTYTVTVHDANNCTTTIGFTITSPPQLTFTSVATPVTCNGACNGQIAVTASGGTAPYQYSSNNGSTFSSANPLTGLCAGPIGVVVQDANGCLANNTVTITQPPVLTATFVKTNPICEGVCNGQIVVTASGGSPAYQYAANGGALQGSTTLTGLCGGPNNILVQDSQGCQFTSIQTLVDPPGYNIDQVTMTESNCGFNNGAIEVAADGTNGPFTYSLENGPAQASGVFSNLLGGAYSIVATDALGCQEQVFFGINDVEMDGVVLVETDAQCFGSADGGIEVTNVSGAPPITYELDNSGITQTTGIFWGLLEGSHVVTIYDGGFCVFTLPFTTNQPDLITFGTTATNVVCNGGVTGSIAFTGVAGGTPGYQYSIDNGATYQTSPNFTGLTAGTYDLAVMDAHNCVVNGTVTITQPPALTLSTSKLDLSCNGNASGFIQLAATGGTGAYQFSIDNGATFSATDAYFGQSAGTYNIIVQDAALCQLTGTLILNEPAPLAATYTPVAALCNGVCNGQLAIATTGGTMPYQFSTNNGTTFTVASTVTNLCAGTYQIVVKDSNNCSITSTQVITEPAGMNVNITLTPATCSQTNGAIQIAASGGMPAYSYSINNGTTFGAGSNFTNLAAGNYTVVVKDQNNCTATSPQIVQDQASPIITGTFLTHPACNGDCNGQVFVTATSGTGALSYSLGGAPQASSTLSGLCAGTYLLTVSDQNACQDTQTVVLTQPMPLNLTTTITDLVCFGDDTGEIVFTASGGTFPYLYSTDNGVTFSSQNIAQFLPAGTYNLVLKDQHNCQVNAAVIVNGPPELVITNQISNNATCHDACDGTATVMVGGGSFPYTFSWTNGMAGATTVANLCAGTYDVEITDFNGCQVAANFNITEPPVLNIVSTSSTDVLCNGDCNGTVLVNSPQAVDFSINGFIFQPSNTFNNLCPGPYTVTARDATGCIQTEDVFIQEPLPLVQNVIPEDGITICYDGYGTLSASATGGVEPYYFIWNTGDTTQLLNVNLTLPTTFTCTVVDQNGCISNTSTADVNIRPPFIPSVTTPITVCPGGQATMTASGTDGLPGYNYQWLTPEYDTLGNGVGYGYIPASTETILLVANDACFLYDTLEVSVTILTPQIPEFTVTPAVGCSPLDASFVNITPGAAFGTATWFFGDGTSGTGNINESHQYTEVGCYDVTLEFTNVNGCFSDTTIQNVVCVVPDPVADFTFYPQSPTTVNSEVQFTDHSTNAQTYSWDFGDYGGSTEENPEVNFAEVPVGDQVVCLTIVSPEGCVSEVCKPIPFIEEFVLFIPNSFTPDADEYNPTFGPAMPPGLFISDYTFLIYDRWGEVIFESHDWNIGWDGTYHGQVVKEGAYTWTLQLIGGPQQLRYRYNGHVNLLR